MARLYFNKATPGSEEAANHSPLSTRACSLQVQVQIPEVVDNQPPGHRTATERVGEGDVRRLAGLLPKYCHV
jgi:hypothetical protein